MVSVSVLSDPPLHESAFPIMIAKADPKKSSCLTFGDPEIFARRSCFKVRADPQPRDSGALGFKYFNNIIAS